MRVWFSKCSACNEWSCVSIKKYKLTHICGILFPARHIIDCNELHEFTKVYLLCNLINILCQTYRNTNCDQNSTIENDWKTWIPNKTKQKNRNRNTWIRLEIQICSLVYFRERKFTQKENSSKKKKCNELFQLNFQEGSWEIYSMFFFLSISRLWVLILRFFYWNCHFFLSFAEK